MSWTNGRAIAGVSGGRTSAVMGKKLPKDVVLAFENTSKEATKTYEFIDRLEQDLERPIVRLEFRAPPRGCPPIEATFEIMRHHEMARDGSVFEDMLEMCAAYRRTLGKPPIAPWARSRICTAYLKVRTQRKFCLALGWGKETEYTEFVGYRADEPDRVAKMNVRNESRDTDERAPLYDLGLTRADVMSYWEQMPYDLGLPEHMGNCTGCFLKDERDLASALLEDETDAEWWIEVEEKYAPMRRGRPSYRQVLEEAPQRMKIRAALERGEPFSVDLPPRRVKLIVAQERSVRVPFTCECDAAKADDFDEQLELAL